MLRGLFLLGASASLQLYGGTVELGAALRNKEVCIAARALGGHSGPCVRVEAENLTGRALALVIPSGWRFASADSAHQDLLVVGEHMIALEPGSRGAIACRAFCCEAYDHSPAPASAFDAGRLADERLVKLALHLAAMAYPEAALQQAIWAVSSGTPLSAIDAGDAAATQRLRQFVAALTGRPVPWYTTAFAAPGAGRAFNPAPVRITGRVDFQQRHAGMLTIVVKDGDGRTVHVLTEGRDLRQGRYGIDVVLTVGGWPPGRYSLCFATDGVLLKEQAFEL
jgi:hypothetical protein